MEKVLKKLGYKSDEDVLLLNVPKDIEDNLLSALGKNPDKEILNKKYTFIMDFCENKSVLDEHKYEIIKALEKDGRLWIIYPKKTSKKYKSDLSRDILWNVFGDTNFEPVSNFAVDEDWSALRFRPVDEIKSLSRDIKRAATKDGKKRIEEGGK